ncbi:MAG: DsrE/DsrF/DrsH-like family protein [Nitrososphaerota archaeon]
MKKIALIVNTASFERVAYALSFAVVAAAYGTEVFVLFGFEGLYRLIKRKTDVLGDETNPFIRNEIESGLKKGSMMQISELIKNLKNLGGKIYACTSAMALHNVTKDELIEEVDGVLGLAAFLELIDDPSTIIYV